MHQVVRYTCLFMITTVFSGGGGGGGGVVCVCCCFFNTGHKRGTNKDVKYAYKLEGEDRPHATHTCTWCNNKNKPPQLPPLLPHSDHHHQNGQTQNPPSLLCWPAQGSIWKQNRIALNHAHLVNYTCMFRWCTQIHNRNKIHTAWIHFLTVFSITSVLSCTPFGTWHSLMQWWANALSWITITITLSTILTQ